MDAEGDLRRLRFFSRGSSALLLAITIIMIVLTFVMAVGTGILLTNPSGLDMEPEMTRGQSALFGVALIAALVLATTTFAIIFCIMHRISRDHSPFTERNVRQITALSAIYAIMPVFLTTSACVGVSNSMTIAIAGTIFFLPSLFVSALLYTLALVFRYGCSLQKESDETL